IGQAADNALVQTATPAMTPVVETQVHRPAHPSATLGAPVDVAESQHGSHLAAAPIAGTTEQPAALWTPAGASSDVVEATGWQPAPKHAVASTELTLSGNPWFENSKSVLAIVG